MAEDLQGDDISLSIFYSEKQNELLQSGRCINSCSLLWVQEVAIALRGYKWVHFVHWLYLP